MNSLEMLIVAGLIALAVVYVIARARRKHSQADGCGGECGCGKTASTQTDRGR